MKVPLLAATILLVFVGFTHGAGTGPLTTTTVQTLNGDLFKIAGGFTVIQTGFTSFATGSPIPATTSCSFIATVCYLNEIFAGNWSMYVTLQANAGAIPASGSTTYTLQISGLGAGSISFSVPSTTAVGSPASFFFDTGTQTVPSTTLIIVRVQ